MPPKTPKNPVSDKPEDGLQAAQAQPPVPAPAASLEAAAQALAAEAPPATVPPVEAAQDSTASQAAPGSDLPAADSDPLLPLVHPAHEVLGVEMTAQPPVADHLRVRVLRLIEHDGVRYGPGELAGDELEVTEAQFQLLNPIQAAERL